MSQSDIYTVSRLNSEVRLTLELQFRQLWLVGEVSNFVAASSGHWYFSLKDQAAQVKVAMFKQANRNAQFTPRNGQQIMVRARISVYEPRGEYQLLADFVEAAGDGLLRQQYEQLKVKLQAEGLFAPERKRAIPAEIHAVGVITSPTGAAIRDILTVLQRRAPQLQVIIYPALVQGQQAANDLRAALSHAIRRAETDVLIIGRGGGSLEDLWCFNDEALARQIAASPIPIVSAVGHEIDFSISDFVADIRAATPSAAAELVSTDQLHRLQLLKRQQQQLCQAQWLQLSQLKQALQQQQRQLQLQHPARQLQQQQQRLDELEQRLQRAYQQQFKRQQQRALLQHKSLQLLNPLAQLQARQQSRLNLQQRLSTVMAQQLKQRQQRWQNLGALLHQLSPLATLQRGYSISFNQQQQVITHTQQVAVGEQVMVKLAQGQFQAVVSSIESKY